MAHKGFAERDFRCSICDAKFKALAGPTPPTAIYCGDCGLKYSAEQLDALRLAKERKNRK